MYLYKASPLKSSIGQRSVDACLLVLMSGLVDMGLGLNLEDIITRSGLMLTSPCLCGVDVGSRASCKESGEYARAWYEKQRGNWWLNSINVAALPCRAYGSR